MCGKGSKTTASVTHACLCSNITQTSRVRERRPLGGSHVTTVRTVCATDRARRIAGKNISGKDSRYETQKTRKSSPETTRATVLNSSMILLQTHDHIWPLCPSTHAPPPPARAVSSLKTSETQHGHNDTQTSPIRNTATSHPSPSCPLLDCPKSGPEGLVVGDERQDQLRHPHTVEASNARVVQVPQMFLKHTAPPPDEGLHVTEKRLCSRAK